MFVRSRALYAFFDAQSSEDRAAAKASAEIALLRIEDRSVRPVTRNQVRDLDPSWGPSGEAIYCFEDAGDLRRLVRLDRGAPPVVVMQDGHLVSDARVTRTRVSPDGNLLAYAKEVDGRYGLYLYDLRRREERPLAGGS